MFSEPNNLPFPLLIFNVTCEIRLDQTSSLLKLNAVDCLLCVAITQWLYSTNQEGWGWGRGCGGVGGGGGGGGGGVGVGGVGGGGGLLSRNFSFTDSSAFVICCIR